MNICICSFEPARFQERFQIAFARLVVGLYLSRIALNVASGFCCIRIERAVFTFTKRVGVEISDLQTSGWPVASFTTLAPRIPDTSSISKYRDVRGLSFRL